MLYDVLGNPFDFMITAGQKHDTTEAIYAKILLADNAYNSDVIRLSAVRKGMKAYILSRPHLAEAKHYDNHIYKEKYKIEHIFRFLKHFRRLFSRFDRKKKTF